jgi:hypothetical protein
LTLADRRRQTVHHHDYDSGYLLTGHVRCMTCGGSIGVVSRSHGRRRAYFYGCIRGSRARRAASMIWCCQWTR